MFKSEIDFESSRASVQETDEEQLVRTQRNQRFALQFREIQKLLDKALHVEPDLKSGLSAEPEYAVALFIDRVSFIKRQLALARKKILSFDVQTSCLIANSMLMIASIDFVCQQTHSSLAGEIRSSHFELVKLYRNEFACKGFI